MALSVSDCGPLGDDGKWSTVRNERDDNAICRMFLSFDIGKARGGGRYDMELLDTAQLTSADVVCHRIDYCERR